MTSPEHPKPDLADSAAAGQALAQLSPEQAAILAFNSSPALASALGVPPARLQQETLRLLQPPQQPAQAESVAFEGHAFQPAPPPPAAEQPRPRPPPRAFSLRLRHECTALGCASPGCPLCSQAQSRRCSRDPAAKYLVGDALAAACGAPIAVEATDAATGEVLAASELPGVALRVAVVSARRVEEASGGGAAPGAAALEALAVGRHGARPLLGAHKNAGVAVRNDAEGRAVLVLGAPLSALAISASSEAVLGGQRPQFQLLVTPVDVATGDPLCPASAPPLLTAGFVVATPRVRAAVKRDIPHLSDPISKLKAVGKATQTRLGNLAAAFAEAGGPPLPPPLPAVFTVGDFQRLVEWVGQDPERTDRVKKGLKLTKGWEEACAHAAAAVGTDTRLRVFRHGADAGLVFGGEQGLPQLAEGPLGVLKLAALEAAPAAAAAVYCGDPRRGGELPWGGTVPGHAIVAAVEAWHAPGHPGWSLLSTETALLKAHTAAHPGEPLLVPAFQEAGGAPVRGRVLEPGAALPAPAPPAAPPPPGGADALAFSLAMAAVQAMQLPNHKLESLLEGLAAQGEAGAADATEAATEATPEATPLAPPTADALLRASGTLMRTLTPEWAHMASLTTQEWQQLLQQAEELSGDAGGSPDPFPPPPKRHRDT